MSDPPSDFDPVEEVAESFLARYRLGERPDLSEYVERYPHLAEQIRVLFPALVLMEEAGAAAGGTPACLGEYRIVREIGRGGMGVVYEAVQESLGRRVALKVLPFWRQFDPQRLERFRREARAAARLHHTNIVPVFGVGEDRGVHFYAMQYIRGQGLDAVLDEVRRRRTGEPTSGPTAPGTTVTAQLAECLRSGQFAAPAPAPPAATSADATAPGSGGASGLGGAAHADYYRGVARVGVQAAEALDYAHRHGVLHRDVKPSNLMLDAEGTVWVMDFGLARAEGAEGLTADGDLVGTLRYMAPERFRGEADPRSDVYALGLTLYELLTLRPAFEGDDRARLLQRVLHETPPPPRRLDPRVPRDLETVVLKAIAREPSARYDSAAALAEDLGRFLGERPIRARRVGLLERGWRWCKRNPAVAGLALAVVVALVAGTAVASYFALRADAEARQAERSARAADDSAARARTGQEGAERHLYLSRMGLAQAAWRGGNLDRRGELLAEMRPQPGRPDLRHFEWYYLDRLYHADLLTIRVPHNVLLGLAYSPDGRRLAAGSWDGHVRVWDAVTGKEQFAFKAGTGFPWAVAFSPDGRRLACGSGPTVPPGTRPPAPALSGEVRVWGLDGGREVLRLRQPGGAVLGVAFSPDGRRLATAAGSFASVGAPQLLAHQGSGGVTVWDAGDGRVVHSLGRGGAYAAVAFSPDGTRLAAGGFGLKVWDLAGGREVVGLKRHCSAMAYSPAGARLAAGGWSDDSLRVYDAGTGKEVVALKGPTPTALAFSPDGKRLAAGSPDRTVRTWDLERRNQLFVLKHHHAVAGVAYSPDGKRLAAASEGGVVKVWDGVRGAEPLTVDGRGVFFSQAAYSRDGRRLAAWGHGTVAAWDAASGREVFRARADAWDNNNGIALRPDGAGTATTSRDGKVRVWGAGGRESRCLDGPARPVGAVSYVAGGRLVGAAEGTVPVWDADTGRLLRSLPVQVPARTDVAFSPDGRYAAWRQGTGELRVWDLDAGREACVLRGHTDLVLALEFSADGRRLASCGRDQTVRVWDVAAGRARFVLKGHAAFVHAIAFSADGRRLASASRDRTVRLWDLATGEEALVLEIHAHAFPLSVSFHPDGRRLACVTAGGGALRLLDTRPAASPGR